MEEGDNYDLDQAKEMLVLQDEVAQEHLTPAHRANPLYNLACVEALRNNVDEALSYLQEAINNGWDDFEHTRNDEDLSNLRSNPSFQALVGLIPDNSVSNPATPDSTSKPSVAPEVASPSPTDTPSPSPSTDSASGFKEKLGTLRDMGWTDLSRNIKALIHGNGDLIEAIKYLTQEPVSRYA
jgi:hypothetical protein